MGKGIVKLGEGQWATKDGKLLAAKETNGRFKNAEFTVTRGSDATYTDKDGLIKRVSAPRNRTTTSSNTLDLFVLAGQSNAMGWLGNASGYPPQEPNLLDSSIKLNYEQIGTTSKSDGWQTLGPQQRQNYGEIFGPEVTFSRLLKRGGYNPAIFKYTQGSTSLADDWRAPGQSGHYDTMVTKFNSAVLDLQNQGYVVNIAGFIWIQGEQDATDSTDASNYQSNLNAIISDFRTNVASNSTLQFVLGVDEGNPASNISTIVTAQNNIANGDANIVRSSMVGLEKADSTHLTPAGIIDHGKRIYDSMFDLASAEPRIDFTNNTDGHLLLEPQSTNLLPHSENFNEWTGLVALSIGLNQGISPNGSTEANLLSIGIDSSATRHRLYNLFSFVEGDTYTYSLFAKKNENDWLQLMFSSSAFDVQSYANFDLNNGVVGNEGTSTTADIIDYGNGWYRCSITCTASASVTTTYEVLTTNNTNSGRYPSYQSSAAVNVCFLWGAQLEELSYATSYIPTNGSTVTRDGETCKDAGEAIDFSSEGVLYAEIAALANSGTWREINLDDGSTNNAVEIRYKTTANQFQFVVRSGGTAVVSPTVTISNPTEFMKVAFSYKTDDCKMYINGVEVATDTSGTMPSGLNHLSFDWGGTNPFHGKCKAIRVYKEALSDSELTTLTS